MTSLTEVYEGNAREVSSLRRLYAGTGLVLVGAALAILAVLVAATDPFSGVFADQYAAIRAAGVLAGVGVPAALVGVFIVLPASSRVKAAAAIGASLCLFGVVLFWHAYPHHWNGHGDNLTLHVSVVYLLGLFTAVWCLFTAVVNFKTRNDPGGMLEMNVVRRGRTKVVEVDEGRGLGGIGLLGGVPDGEVETQTNAAEANSDASGADAAMANASASADGTPGQRERGKTGRSKRTRRRAPAPGGAATSDGGSAARDLTSPLDESGAEVVDGPADPAEPADRYCGNCRHFRYVRASSGMVPYCGRFDEPMDDMDACEEWAPNRS